MKTTPDLSALVAARLCHDLISPLGAVRNGLELMQMAANPGAPGAEIDLVSNSLETALAKMRYYRLAFGPADPEIRQAFTEAVQVTDAMFAGRFSVVWENARPDMSRPTARLIYLALLCLEKSLPMGGLVQVSVADDGIRLACEGRRMSPPAGLWEHVTDGRPAPELRADAVQFGLLRVGLVEGGRSLDAEFTETGAKLALSEVTPAPV